MCVRLIHLINSYMYLGERDKIYFVKSMYVQPMVVLVHMPCHMHIQ